MSTKLLTVDGPTAINIDSKLKAFCSLERLPIGSTVQIGPHVYTVKACRYIEMKLFVKSNRVNVLSEDIIFREDNKIKDFISTLGIPNKNMFISAFWKRAKISGLIASTSGFYCDFTDFSIFDSK
jgi:hypothetical protein